jgi:glucose/arabinose dehydrogenase
MKRFLLAAAMLLFAATCGYAQPKKKASAEDEYYPILRFDLPKGEVLEGGALEMMPDGKVAFGTRRGEIWMVENAFDPDVSKAKFTRFAHGLHEILGLAQKDGWLYVTHRPEVTRIKDTNGDGKADLFETVTDGWEINGDYHEYAFGSRFDKDGNLWFTLCLTGSFNSSSKFRGWAGKVTPDGKFVPTTSGVRSPGGIGFNAEGDVFYTDNQGPWNGTCGLKCITVGGFVGHPDSFKWYKDPAAQYLGQPPVVPKTKSRQMIEAAKIPQFYPTCIMFPYQKMGNSTAGFDVDLSGGKFGPFQKQLFAGDQSHSTIMRVFLEKVDGKYQGALFPFREGMTCGIVPVRFAPDGSLFAGGTNRGWGSRTVGGKNFSLDRIVWTGKVPFEVHEMRAKPDGFELTFTKPIDPKSAGDVSSYSMKTWTYIYQADYGSPEVDHTTPKIVKAEVVNDKTVRLTVEGLVPGNVHHLVSSGVRSAEGTGLLHTDAYYTLNYIPKQ